MFDVVFRMVALPAMFAVSLGVLIHELALAWREFRTGCV